VFIDFMDDERSLTERQNNFTNPTTATTNPPNFVILVGKLPRKTVNNDSYVTVKCASDTSFDGVYQNTNTGHYKHTEKTGIDLSYGTAGWILNKFDAIGSIYGNVDLAKGDVKNLLTDFSGGDVVVTAGTPVYVQNYNDISTTPKLNIVDIPNEYTFHQASYKKIGTIYKSIYHDHYYKYCTHGEYNELFFDCSKEENVPDIDSRMKGENMFAFIRLYERSDLTYANFNVKNHPFLYPDTLKFANNGIVDKLFNITTPYK
jgi:hypothetical protein